MKFVVVLTFLGIWYSAAQQDGKDVNKLIDTIFTKPTTAPTTNKNSLNLQPSTGTGTGSSGGIPGVCECVPYYLCNNGSIINDGVGVIDIRIDDGPCNYLAVCCKPPDQRKKENPIKPPPDTNKPKGCGIRNPNGVGFRITGAKDHEAQFGEFPWMVAVLREESVENNPQKLLVYQCGASLIHPQVVLTAAHCVAAKDKLYKVRAGEWDTQTKNELYSHQDRDVVAIKTHPAFYSGGLFYDFALLFLNSPLEIAENVDVVCLPRIDAIIPARTRCFASGWGKDVFGKEGKYQVILKKVEVPIVEYEDCQDRLRKTRLGEYFVLNDTFVCAGGEPGKDTCKGDGGSPLVCLSRDHPGKYEQFGIVAWGIGCGEDNTPGVYAANARVTDWIEEELLAQNLETSYFKP